MSDTNLSASQSHSETLFLYCTAYTWLGVCEAIQHLQAFAGLADCVNVEAYLPLVSPQSHSLTRFFFAFHKEYADDAGVRALCGRHSKKDLFEMINSRDNNTAAACLLVDEAISQLNFFWEGERTGDNIIFSMRGISRWNQLFLKSVLTRWNTQAIISLVSKHFPQTGRYTWCELGAGVGGSAYEVISYAIAHDLVKKFYFTDVSSAFFGSFRRNIGRLYPEHKAIFKCLELDINKMEKEPSCDIVYATNVLHNATDMLSCFKKIRNILNNGKGFLIVSETIRSSNYRHIFLELIYMFLTGYANLPVHATSSERGLMSDDEWIAVIEKSDFTLVDKIQFHPWNAAYFLT